MWTLMTEMWVWVAALADMALSGFIASLLVEGLGWRWEYMVVSPLDASNSMLGFWMVIAISMPIVLFMVSVPLLSRDAQQMHVQ